MRRLIQSFTIAGQQAHVQQIAFNAPRRLVRLQVWINNLAVGPITMARSDDEGDTGKPQWSCERCGHTCRSKQQMLTHVYSVHYRRMLLQQAARMPLKG